MQEVFLFLFFWFFENELLLGLYLIFTDHFNICEEFKLFHILFFLHLWASSWLLRREATKTWSSCRSRRWVSLSAFSFLYSRLFCKLTNITIFFDHSHLIFRKSISFTLLLVWWKEFIHLILIVANAMIILCLKLIDKLFIISYIIEKCHIVYFYLIDIFYCFINLGNFVYNTQDVHVASKVDVHGAKHLFQFKFKTFNMFG